MLAEKLIGYRVQVVAWYNDRENVVSSNGIGLMGKIVAVTAHPEKDTNLDGAFKAVVLLDNGRLHTCPTEWLKVV